MRRTFLQFVLILCTTVHIVFAGPIEDCKEFAAYGVPSLSGDLLCRKGYLLSHDPDKKTPVWVAEHLTWGKAKGTVKRSNDFQADGDLEQGKRAELSDYKGSGYDRGHMAPAADMSWDGQAMSESFYLSNMVPQAGVGMNRGIWMELEKKVRRWALERGELYVYSGPIYEREPKTIGRNRVAVPRFLFKVVLDPQKQEAIAVIMPNRQLKTEDMPNFLVSVREVEKQTGLQFFSNLPEAAQDKIETVKAPKLWQ
ncbi:MAG: endonuclease [Geobacteraceae bacterium GWC2_58_44]|nr:MAG: endonuclease [Geobacteraceae bacterium GWC2_58_44]HBG07258.1 DNA/RNA non-specific endonuclease [Geobacter sp.]